MIDLTEFLRACCIVRECTWLQTSELWATYLWWSEQAPRGAPRWLDRHALHQALRSNGFWFSRSRRTTEGKWFRAVEGLYVKPHVAELVLANRHSRTE